MAYTPNTWADGDTTKPVSAARMTKIETGVSDAHTAIAAIQANPVPDGAITDTKIVANKYLVGSTGGWEAIEDRLGTSFLQGGTYDDVNGTWTPNASSGGGSGAFGTLIYCIPASDLVAWPANGTGAQKNAAINANDARIVHEMVTRPGYKIMTDPGQWWPVSILIDEFAGTYIKPDGSTGTLIEGARYALGGRFLQCRGTRTASDDTATSSVQSATTLQVIRKPDNNGLVITPTNLRIVQLGASGPNLGSYFTMVCTGFDVTTNLALYKAGGLLDIVSQNEYNYSARAGYGDGTAGTGVYKGAFMPIAGLSVNVTGYSLTALNTALGTGNSVSTLERRTIVGASSGVFGIVQGGDFGANGQILVNGVSGNFTAGETLRDQATNATIGTYSSTTVLMSGKLNCAYDNTPQIRFITKSYLDIEDVWIKTDGEIDDVIEGYNRPDAVHLTGCTQIQLDGLHIQSGYSTGLTMRSCWDYNGMVHVRDLPNHALESLTERAYGYAVRFLGHCQNGRVGLDVARVRHGMTSNAIRGTWNLNSRTGQSNGATSLCTNFWNHGPGMRSCTLYGRVENTWSACWDFHEGAEDIFLDHPIAIQPTGSGRATTSPDGFSIRGFGITVVGAYSEGCRIGIYDLAGPLDSGGLAYTNTYIGGVHKKCQAGGYFQSEDTFDESLARFELHDNTFRLDPDARTAYPQQFGMLIRKGNVAITNNRLSSVGYAFFRLTSFVGSGGSTATGHVLLLNNDLDWTDSTASRPFSYEATYDEITEYGNHARVNPVAGTQRPSQWSINSGGNSNVRYGGRSISHLSTTKSDPSAVPSITGGTPTFTSLDTVGGGAAGHVTTTAPTATAQAGAGTGPSVVFATGSTDVSGEVRVTAGTAPTTGSFVSVTYGTAFAADVFPQVTPGLNAHTRAIGVTTHSATGFTVQFGNSPAASTEYRFTYSVSGV